MIEKNIPPPDYGRSKYFRGILSQMEVGDSCPVSLERNARSGLSVLRIAAKNLGMRITVRNNNGEIRFWRIE